MNKLILILLIVCLSIAARDFEYNKIESQINDTKILGTIGSVFFITGVTTSLTGEILFLANLDNIDIIKISIPLIYSGSALYLTGPILSVVGENKLSKILVQNNVSAFTKCVHAMERELATKVLDSIPK